MLQDWRLEIGGFETVEIYNFFHVFTSVQVLEIKEGRRHAYEILQTTTYINTAIQNYTTN